MRALLRDCYQALESLPAAISRGWPQAALPLPLMMLSLMEDRLLEDGQRLQSIGVKLRAASPEAADALSADVDVALAALRLIRRGCLDGAESDRGSFLKLMRYERLLPPAWLPDISLALGPQSYPARLLERRRARERVQAANLQARQAAVAAGRPLEAISSLALPPEALAPLEAAYGAGLPLQLTEDGQPRQVRLMGYRLSGGRLVADISE